MTRATCPSMVRGPRCEVSPLLSMARMVSALFPFSLYCLHALLWPAPSFES